MSGQYKIRSNSQDNFSDVTGGVQQATGGCVQVVQSCLGFIILLAICGFIFSLVSSASAQSAPPPGDSCFPHKTLYTTIPVEFRRDLSYIASYIGKTKARNTYKVYESKKAALFGSCWIRIQDGWLLRKASGSAIKPGTYTPPKTSGSTDTQSTSATSGRCYTSSKAYITGVMNIRSGPGTNNRKVGSASAGQSFTVTQSRRGGDYCWLKVSKGWIAKTERVRSTKPPAYRPSSTNRAGLPRISGDSHFVKQATTAFNLLRDKAPRWFNYVVVKNPTVEEHWGGLSGVWLPQKTIVIGWTHVDDIAILAGVLVHEACHIYQWHEGRYGGDNADDRIRREVECMKIQVEAMTQFAPGHGFINSIRKVIRNPHELYG